MYRAEISQNLALAPRWRLVEAGGSRIAGPAESHVWPGARLGCVPVLTLRTSGSSAQAGKKPKQLIEESTERLDSHILLDNVALDFPPLPMPTMA